MAEIVGGFLLPHPPLMFTDTIKAPEEKRGRVNAAYQHIANRIDQLEATTVIIVGADHYILFGPQCLPGLLIGIGDVDGPIENFPSLPRYQHKVNQSLASHIMAHGRANSVDWAVAKAFSVDHAISIPHHLVVKPNEGVEMIPIYIDVASSPRIKKQRAYRLGQQIKQAVQAYPENDRVVIIGSGGLSHWVGSAPMGRVNAEFDQKVITWIESGDHEKILALSDEEILEQGGEGALEICQWLCAIGAMEGAQGKCIAYEAVEEWITGMGFIELIA